MRRPISGASPMRERRTSPRFSFARGRTRPSTLDTPPTSSRLSICWVKRRSTFLEKKWPRLGIGSGGGRPPAGGGGGRGGGGGWGAEGERRGNPAVPPERGAGGASRAKSEASTKT